MATKFDKIRSELMQSVATMFEGIKYDVLRTGSTELCVPIVGEDNEEGYLVISFKVPKGSRDGDVYDGYEVAKDYERHCAEMAEKAKVKAAEKAKKIERDRKMREEKARLKAEREANQAKG